MAKSKYYVVWNGRKPGIYEGWEACKEQVTGFNGAKYKGFPTADLARSAMADDPRKYMEKGLQTPKKIVCRNPLIGEPVADSICVDAACSGNPGCWNTGEWILCQRRSFFGLARFLRGP